MATTSITVTVPDYELADNDTESLTERVTAAVEDWLWASEDPNDPKHVGETYGVTATVRVRD